MCLSGLGTLALGSMHVYVCVLGLWGVLARGPVCSAWWASASVLSPLSPWSQPLAQPLHRESAMKARKDWMRGRGWTREWSPALGRGLMITSVLSDLMFLTVEGGDVSNSGTYDPRLGAPTVGSSRPSLPHQPACQGAPTVGQWMQLMPGLCQVFFEST